MKKNKPFRIAGLFLSIIFLLFMFAGCGDDDDDGAAAPAAGLQKVEGVAMKGPFEEGSTVKAYKFPKAEGDTLPLATATVEEDASYILSPPFDYVGAVLIEVKGVYINELTGSGETDYVDDPFEIIIITEETTAEKTYKANLSPASALATAIIKKEIANLDPAPTAEEINSAVLGGYAAVASFILPVVEGNAIDAIAQIDIRGTGDKDKAVAIFNAKLLKAVTADGGILDAGAGNKVKLSSLVEAMATAYVDKGDINKVTAAQIAALEVVNAITGDAVTGVTVTAGANATAENLFDDIVAVTLTAADLNNINTYLETEEDLTADDVTDFEDNASAELKALALTGNKVTFAKGDMNYEVSGTIDCSGLFTPDSAIPSAADRTVTFTLDNVGVADGTYSLDMAFYVKDKAILTGTSKREVYALIKGVELKVSETGAFLTVPVGATVYWSGKTSAGTAVKGYIPNLTQNAVFVAEGSSFTYDGSVLYENVLDKFGESSEIVSFTEAGTYEFGVVVSGVPVGYVFEGKITKLLPFAKITVQKMAD